MAESKLSMKLLINSQTNKVLFAEAGKDCVDFLFHLMSLPIASVIKLLREQGMVGCLGNLYDSIENLNETYIEPGKTKDALLKPTVVSSVPLFLIEGSAGKPTGKLGYTCAREDCNVFCYSDYANVNCPKCKRKMITQQIYVPPPSGTIGKEFSANGGFVKGVVTYMVMDDLVVQPMSTISSLTLISKFNVKDVTALKEKEVNVGMKEAVKLLKTCLHSKNVLTEVFLNNN